MSLRHDKDKLSTTQDGQPHIMIRNGSDDRLGHKNNGDDNRDSLLPLV